MGKDYNFAETAEEQEAVRRSARRLAATALALIVGTVVARVIGWIP